MGKGNHSWISKARYSRLHPLCIIALFIFLQSLLKRPQTQFTHHNTNTCFGVIKICPFSLDRRGLPPFACFFVLKTSILTKQSEGSWVWRSQLQLLCCHLVFSSSSPASSWISFRCAFPAFFLLLFWCFFMLIDLIRFSNFLELLLIGFGL